MGMWGLVYCDLKKYALGAQKFNFLQKWPNLQGRLVVTGPCEADRLVKYVEECTKREEEKVVQYTEREERRILREEQESEGSQPICATEELFSYEEYA